MNISEFNQMVYAMVSNAVSKHTDPIYDLKNGVFFWKSKNYEEYAMMCDLEGISPAFTEQEFYAMKN